MKNKSLTIRLRLWTGMSNYYSLSVPGRHASIPYFLGFVKANLRRGKNVICMVSRSD